MRLLRLIRGDIRCQQKYGFYLLYVVFTLLYIILAYLLPTDWRQMAVLLMVFSDPAALGLYFMGALVLFERSEHVLDSLAVSPVTPGEYVLAKLLSLAFISLLVGLSIALGSGQTIRLLPFLTGLLLGALLFSAVGLWLAACSISLNDFILNTVPVQLLINLPAIVYIFGWNPAWLLLHPGVSLIVLLRGTHHLLPAFLVLVVWCGAVLYLAWRSVRLLFVRLGGVSL